MLQALALFRNRNFALAWISTIFEHMALAIALLSETWYVVDTLHMKAQLGWVMIASTVPRIVLMAIGGVLADRYPKTRILSVTFWLRMIAMLGGALLFWQHWMTIWALIGFAAVFGILDAFFWPARDALLPSIVADHQLTQANSIMQATNQFGLMLGPMVGGVLLVLAPFHIIFTITAAMMAAGALIIGLINEGTLLNSVRNRSILTELKEGIRYAISHPVLRNIMLIYVIANLIFVGPIVLGAPIIASEHLTHGAQGLSFLESALATGMAVGFITLIVFPPAQKRLLLITAIIAVEGVLLALLGQVYTLWLAILLQFMIGFCIACNNVPMLSLIQHYTERSKMGRVMSLNSMSSMGLAPVSYALVSALLAGGISIGFILALFGLVMTVAMVIIAVSSTAIRTTD